MSLLFAVLSLFSLASAEAPWWEDLGDPGLVDAIETGLSDNGDLEASWERVAASEALARQAWAPILPSAQVSFSSTTAPYDSLGFQFGLGGGFGGPAQDTPDVYHTGSFGLGASWELDLFGRNYTSMRASRYDARAAAGDLDAGAKSLAVRIASTWYDLVATEQRLGIIRRQIETQERTLEITELRFAGGEATGLDVLQQRQQLASTKTLLPPMAATQQVLQQQLSVLLGQRFDTALPARPQELPSPAPPQAEVPADLAQNRPDLVAASERVRSAKARKNSAMSSLAPRVSLSAQTGAQFSDFGEFDSQKYWNVGTSATLPIFQGGRTFEGIRASTAQQRAAEHQLEQATLLAEAEVAGLISREEQQRAYVAAVEEQREAARLAHEAPRVRYRAGSAAYVNVLTSSNAELQAELSYVAAQRDLLGLRIDLNDALGGSWTRDLGERANR